jgi:KUP system potassium uptake protein
MLIRQTSEHHAGQIYIPVVNWMLLAGVLMLIGGFRSSSAMAAAYGIAVTGTMVITTALAFVVVWRLWRWRFVAAAAFIAPFMLIDIIFFGANILRVAEGGWVPLLVAAILGLTIATWIKGRNLLGDLTSRDLVPMADLARALAMRPPTRVEGTAVYLTSSPEVAPVALLHNLKHNRVLHRRNVILSVVTASEPHLREEERLRIEAIDDNFTRASLNYGYMETPDVPSDLLRDGRIGREPGGTSFFIGRNSIGMAKKRGMPIWQDIIFIFLQKNASDPTTYLQIPPNRVVELGSRIEI